MSLIVAAGSVTAFVVSALGTWVALVSANKKSLYDHPGHRSSHTIPTPRLGGIGIALGALLAGILTSYWASTQERVALPVIAIIVGGTMCTITGLVDDLKSGGLSPRVKFGGQLLAALVSLALIGTFAGGAVHVPGRGGWLIGLPLVLFALLWVTALTNFVNFMDGSDGLAAGIAVIILLGYAVATAGAAASTLAYSTVCGASTFAFLLWNRPPAKIFMGDGGSLFLGTTVAVLGIWTALPSVTYGIPAEILEIKPALLMAAVLLVAPFWMDPVTTIALRAAHRRKLGEAHRDHLYQRMIRNGFSHGRVALIYYSYTLACVVAVGLLAHGAPWVGAVLGGLILALGILAVLLGHKLGFAVEP